MSDSVKIIGDLYGSGKPLILAAYCIECASSADDIIDLLSYLRTGKFTSHDKVHRRGLPEPPPIAEWLSLYRNHRRMMDALGPMFGDAPIPADMVADIDSELGSSFMGIPASAAFDGLRELVALPPDERRAEIAELPQSAQQNILALFGGVPWPPKSKLIKAVLAAEDRTSDADVGRAIVGAEYQFFLRAWLPCWIAYKTYPQKLFHRARGGDIDALDDLLRLDKSVLADHLIAEHWHEAAHARNKGRFKRLARPYRVLQEEN